ncbi:MAG: hypothetical protein PUE60_05710 [Eubacteriales bacterium]|nr:hypothetical protein [Eubacteriales bacterium]
MRRSRKNLDYDLNNLRNYLTYNSNNEEIVLSLSEIENIVCGKLPDFSYRKPGHNRFWYNDYNNNSSYAHYWLDAGYYAHCDIDNGIVTFSKSFIKRRPTKIEKQINKVYQTNLDINTALNAIKKYHYSINNEYTRYKSWEHCYNAFKKYRHDKDKTEFLCMHLSCFMASWGMLRNSKLIEYDYFIHKDFVIEISNSKYDRLYDNSFENNDLIKEFVDLINKLYLYKIKARITEGDSLSDTFVTKILLGVFGCVPAYDSYFKSAVSHYKVCSQNFNERSLTNIYSFYNLHFEEFENLRKQFANEGVYYTPMKLIDMCFWQLGVDLENNG